MVFLEWSDAYSVGVKEIDGQHQKLFEMINVFYDNIKTDNKKALGDLLNSLAEYADFHFKTEERYFDKFKYSESDAHKKEHQEFVDKIMELKSNFESGKLVISLSVTNFAKRWITDHINGTDKKYTDCFNSNGLY